MFGPPEAVESKEAVFNLVWSYGIKALDARVRKLDVPAMGPHVRDKFVSLTRLMLIVSTKPALVCFMASRRLRIFLFMGRMFQMPSLRLLHRNRGFTSDQIGHSMSGGPSTRNALQSLMAI
jgi:hypothetical protein